MADAGAKNSKILWKPELGFELHDVKDLPVAHR